MSSSVSDTGVVYFRVYADGRMWIKIAGANMAMFALNDGTTDVFKVYGNGKVVIGSQQVVGTNSDALLQVAGKAAAKSFYVLKPTTWADKVFEREVSLKTLEEIEAYVKEHKHLPGIPSESEIKEKGYGVHEMNVKLLEKVEDLYLMMIELKKENEVLKRTR